MIRVKNRATHWIASIEINQSAEDRLITVNLANTAKTKVEAMDGLIDKLTDFINVLTHDNTKLKGAVLKES